MRDTTAIARIIVLAAGLALIVVGVVVANHTAGPPLLILAGLMLIIRMAQIAGRKDAR